MVYPSGQFAIPLAFPQESQEWQADVTIQGLQHYLKKHIFFQGNCLSIYKKNKVIGTVISLAKAGTTR